RAGARGPGLRPVHGAQRGAPGGAGGPHPRTGKAVVVSESVLVALRDASFAYEDGPPVLTGLDFGVREGRALALLGRNGSGKTTLMRLLSGGLRPAGGALLLGDVPVRYDRKGLTRLRTAVQLVVQDPDDQLFAASVGQDVSFGPLNLDLPDTEVRA